MKNIFYSLNKIFAAAFLGGALLFTSCNYLDVVPPEQPGLKDATKDYEKTLGFLYSCYTGVRMPMTYSGIESASDEWALPALWNEGHHRFLYNLEVPNSLADWAWGSIYQFIGQCHLFTKELEGAQGVTEEDKAEWRAEVDFLLAYYHMQALTLYGPCPINEELVPEDADNSTFPGRSHFDYCVNWIVEKFDKAAAGLPAERDNEKWGRATSTIAKALKARLLLYAASPLWNGSFPYLDWKNKKYETEGYGKELVSHTYDANKWERARVACEDALNSALSAGFRLYTDMSRNDDENVPLPYVPGVDPNTPEGKDFLEHVLLMRYLVTTRVGEGNKEIIWGHASQGNMIMGSLPGFIQNHNNGSRLGGYSGVSPLFSTTASFFYTADGKRPAEDPNFTPSEEWLKSAGFRGREDIIKFNVNREPRFYAWLGFDGGDYMSKLVNGQPLKLQLRDNMKQGMNLSLRPRDNNVTGYLSQKFIEPNRLQNKSGGWVNSESKPRPLVRLAELYLNLAECEAALGMDDKAIEHINPIRERAGIPALQKSDVTNKKTMTEWVRNERFIELWGEGHRYYDVRRWMTAPETMAKGKRTGLNALQKENPTFDEFNKVVPVNQPYVWTSRMYLRPVFNNEVYKNPQLVQAPGY